LIEALTGSFGLNSVFSQRDFSFQVPGVLLLFFSATLSMSQQVADSEYEYDYDDEEDDYPVEDEEDSDDDDAMVHDNPNAAPSGGKGMCRILRLLWYSLYAGLENPFALKAIDDCRSKLISLYQSHSQHLYTNAVSGISMLTPEDLAPEVQRRIHDVQEILNIPPEASMVLLREFNFSKEALLERYYQDSDQVLQKCGVWARCQGKSVSSDSTTSSCPICYEDQLSASQLFAMPCGHTFCKPCWNDFVQTAVADGPSCIRTTCPEASCKEVVTDQEVQQVAPMEMVQKFQLYQLRAFVDSSALTRWCPGRGCDKIASAKNELALEHEGHGVHCTSCQAYFCLRCGQEPHRPCTCAFLQKWLEKCRNESETANWILANTKPCPRCSSRIEKNQGCNHMTCQRCKFEFCWICMGDWNEHGANT
jgi:hypothetical protein